MKHHLLAFGIVVALTGATTQAQRPTVGVAFGGGSARGIAHVGVIRWFEEHRIPIDLAAGTSMGGLIGGAFATGMDAAELDDMLKGLNWDEMFGASSFAFKNIRRKADARAYPSRLEFGLKRGIAAPAALNNGQQVDLLVGRIAAPYYDIPNFDALPTPFRAVAVDHPQRDAGGARSRSAGLGDARHDVAAADLSAGAARRPGAGRRRRHGQRAGGRGPGDGRRPRRSRSTLAICPISRTSTTR